MWRKEGKTKANYEVKKSRAGLAVGSWPARLRRQTTAVSEHVDTWSKIIVYKKYNNNILPEFIFTKLSLELYRFKKVHLI